MKITRLDALKEELKTARRMIDYYQGLLDDELNHRKDSAFCAQHTVSRDSEKRRASELEDAITKLEKETT